MNLRTLDTAGELHGTCVLVRGSLNVPVVDGVPLDVFRIERLLPTLQYLKERGAKILLVAHIGRDPKDSLLPVHRVLNELIPVTWGGAVTSDEFREKRAALQPGEILLAENLRQDAREKANDPEFSSYLSSLATLYVNDAFDNAHREHASMVGVPAHLPAYAGVNLKREVEELHNMLTPKAPSLFLLGGAKFQTKLPLIEKGLAIYDHVFVGGALANDLLKAKGFPVGASLLSNISLDPSLVSHPKLLMPIDVTVEGPAGRRVCRPEEVQDDEAIKDAGPETVALLEPHIAAAKTVLWNGPFGQFEVGYREITEDVARLIAASDAYSVLGGGDTIAAIEPLHLDDQFSFLSTGGGAMLTYLEQGTTTAIDFLRS